METEASVSGKKIYPTKKIFSDDIAVRSLFAAKIRNGIARIMVLNGAQPQEYYSLSLSDDHGKSLIMHLFSSTPSFKVRYCQETDAACSGLCQGYYLP